MIMQLPTNPALSIILLFQTKMANLCGHLKRNGVALRQSLFFPRVVFLSPECELNEELKKREELVTYDLIDNFLRSFREGYVAWISDALTPSWISGEHFLQKYLTNISIRKLCNVLNPCGLSLVLYHLLKRILL